MSATLAEIVEALSVPGKIHIDPADVTDATSGTSLGAVRDVVVERREPTQQETLAFEYGMEPIEVYNMGARFALTFALRGDPAQAFQTLFPDENFQGSTSNVYGYRYPGSHRAGTRRSANAVVARFTPDDPTHHRGVIFYRALPKAAEVLQLPHQTGQELTWALSLLATRNPIGEAVEVQLLEDMTVPALLPTQISTGTLGGWWRADRGITKDGSDLVSAWAAINDPTKILAQSTDLQKPLYTATPTGFNNKPGLTFDRTAFEQLTMADTNNNVPSLVMVVARSSHTGNNMCLFSHVDGIPGTPRSQLFLTLGPGLMQWSVFGPATPDAGNWSSATTALFEGHTADLSSHVARINGTAGTEVTTTVSGQDVTRLILGATANSLNPFDGVISEVIWWTAPPTDANELASVRRYITQRYGIS